MVAVYNAVGWEKFREEPKEIRVTENVNVLVVGDRNARIGEEKWAMASDGSERERASKDEMTNAE